MRRGTGTQAYNPSIWGGGVETLRIEIQGHPQLDKESTRISFSETTTIWKEKVDPCCSLTSTWHPPQWKLVNYISMCSHPKNWPPFLHPGATRLEKTTLQIYIYVLPDVVFGQQTQFIYDGGPAILRCCDNLFHRMYPCCWVTYDITSKVVQNQTNTWRLYKIKGTHPCSGCV